MSRLIIKNIPSYVTSTRLKEHLSQRSGPGGTLTDVKVALKQDGTSRRFAFVGYKSEEEARRAKEYFDRTFIDTTRMSVDIVEKGAQDAPAPRPNKRPRLGPAPSGGASGSASSSARSTTKSPTKSNNLAPAQPDSYAKKNAQLDEFLKVMQPRTKKGKTWLDDVPGSSDVLPSNVSDEPPLSKPSRKARISEADVASRSRDVDDATVGMKNVSVDDLDDLEWMKQRMTEGIQSSGADIEKVFQQDDDDDEAEDDAKDATLAEPEPERDPAMDTIMQTSRLFLRNLAFSCTEQDLHTLFSPFGELTQVHIPLDPLTKSSKGLAFISFKDPTIAVTAYRALDKIAFQGRLLHIIPAVNRKGTNSGVDEDGSGKKMTVKDEKLRKRKGDVGKELNWSMLYMNSDAVASSIADRMNISKADILNPDSSEEPSTSAAVKLALAETHIITETKSYLESEGINLASLSTLDPSAPTNVRQRRSDTCILVKNIPYDTTPEQVRELFMPHGELNRVLVPPAGTIAVVEFVHADEAAKGFKAVAYRRLGSSVIYLEKAPLGIFDGFKKESANSSLSASAKKPVAIPEVPNDTEVGEDDTAAPGSTLFVKNLSFATTSERLTQVFRHLPSFAFARVQTKPDPKHRPQPGESNPPPRLSMGFGFVGFKSPDAAKKALSSTQGFVLDGHTLSVKFAGRGTEQEKTEKTKVSATTTKMVVKNVPFEASKKDIRDLFGAHGQLKSVRLPKKFNSRTRGFAFLEFTTRHEAENAYTALRHTHLLGRHLVLEWAEDSSQDIDALRQKAGVGYGNGTELPGRKRKLELRDDDGDAEVDG